MPIIERLLRRMAAVGVRNATILTGWKGELVRESVESMRLSRSGLSIRFVHEEQPLGNVGGLAFLGKGMDSVLFAFADLVTAMNFSELIQAHQNFAADVTLCSHTEEHQVRLGELVVDGSSVISYHEKPIKRFHICSGIAVLESAVLDLIAPGSEVGMADLINRAISAGLRVRHWEHQALWFDVNTPETLALAEKEIANQPISE